jgi:predicted deacylase
MTSIFTTVSGVTLATACLLGPLAAGAQRPTPMQVGPVTARAGEKVSGFLEIPPGVDSSTRVPITLIQGRTAGPTLALVAGTHGSEVAPIIALQRVRAALDPAQLRGTVILVQVANMPSYLKRTIYYSPMDGKNLNRVYPGRADGTVSERIAYAITNEVIEKSDYLVDMHAGDGNESLRPYTYWSKLGLDARVDSLSRELALAWGHDHIVVDTERPRDPKASVYTQNTAQLRGKPSITTETGYLGMPEDDMVRLNEQGVFRLLRYLKMMPGRAEVMARPVYLERTQVLTSPETGIWYPQVRRGQSVAAGALIGYVTDFFGSRVGEVKAPFAGEMLYVVATPATSKGEPVGMIGAPR